MDTPASQHAAAQRQGTWSARSVRAARRVRRRAGETHQEQSRQGAPVRPRPVPTRPCPELRDRSAVVLRPYQGFLRPEPLALTRPASRAMPGCSGPRAVPGARRPACRDDPGPRDWEQTGAGAGNASRPSPATTGCSTASTPRASWRLPRWAASSAGRRQGHRHAEQRDSRGLSHHRDLPAPGPRRDDAAGRALRTPYIGARPLLLPEPAWAD